MHKFTLFSLNIIVISEKNVIFALVLWTISTKERILIQSYKINLWIK